MLIVKILYDLSAKTSMLINMPEIRTIVFCLMSLFVLVINVVPDESVPAPPMRSMAID